jgi:vacuolar protein sorting-associated protein IST1
VCDESHFQPQLFIFIERKLFLSVVPPVAMPRNPGAGLSSGNGAASGLPNIPHFPEIPDLPSVPVNSVGAASVKGDDVDFDDLTRRFEELKKRK